MKYKIPLNDDSGKTLCYIVWDGTLYEGSASVLPVKGNEDIAKNVSNMILSRKDLSELKFRSEGLLSTVNGWQGYEGVVAALRIMCPSLGLQIGHIDGDTPPFELQRANEIVSNELESGLE